MQALLLKAWVPAIYICAVESPFCTLALGKTEEKAYSRDCDISVRQQLPTNECHVGTQSLHFLWLFDGQT